MSYVLYLDKNELFECSVDVTNASLTNSKARLVINTNDGMNFMFEGQIKNGKCTIPIKKLKGVLDESARGKISLEVIVEDMFFSPWTSEFTVKQHTDVKVSVHEQITLPKAKVNVVVSQPLTEKSVPSKDIDMQPLLEELFTMGLQENLHENGISKHNVSSKIKDVKKLIAEYFEATPDAVEFKSSIINKVIREL